MRRICPSLVAVLTAAASHAITITGYTSADHDRFGSGFPSAPIDSASGSFVGRDYDWSAVGWSATDGTKGFGLISPRHYLVARHYGGATNLAFTDGAGTVATAAQASVVNTDTGLLFSSQTIRDLSVGRLTGPLAVDWSVPRLAVLDLNSSSSTNTLAAYANLQVFLYGRGPSGSASPRIASSSVLSAHNDTSGQYLLTQTTDAAFQATRALARQAVDDGEINLAEAALTEGLGEATVGEVVLRHDHAAAGVLVEAVDDAGTQFAANATEVVAVVQQGVD